MSVATGGDRDGPEEDATAVGRIDPSARMLLRFTCSAGEAKGCRFPENAPERTYLKFISKLAFEKGVVLVRCDCDKLHLIADRLGWFEDGGTDVFKELAERAKKDPGLVHVE